MKMLSFLLAAFLVWAAPSQAAIEVLAPGSEVHRSAVMGLTSNYYQYGSRLASGSVADFTYSLSDGIFRDGSFYGWSDLSSGDLLVALGLKVDGVTSDQTLANDIFISATWDRDNTKGTLTIKNLTDRVIGFGLSLTAILSGTANFYLDGVVSAVPLPAALPLFGLGVASLAAYRARKKKAA